MKRTLIRLFQRYLVTPPLVPYYFHLYKLSLRGLGCLNSEGSLATGENWLMRVISTHFPVRTVVDVGANEGGYTRELAAFFRQADFYCFEPHPETFHLLQANLTGRRFRLYNLALSDTKKSLKLYDFADSAPLKPTQPTATMASLYSDVITRFHRQPAKNYRVSAITLDHWAQSERVKSVDWLKIDTEGHELAVLKGARQLISQNQLKMVQFEFNEMNAYSRVFLKDFLDILPGFTFYRLLPDGWYPLGDYRPLTHELFAFQNLVALCSDWTKILPRGPGLT